MEYLSIKNWGRYQMTDRKGRDIKLYIKDYCGKDNDDPEYSRLTTFQRYMFDAICRLRGRSGRNPQNDPTWIARALCIIPRERSHVAQAIRRLVTDGFLALTNQQVDLSDSHSHSHSHSETHSHMGVVESLALKITEPEGFSIPYDDGD